MMTLISLCLHSSILQLIILAENKASAAFGRNLVACRHWLFEVHLQYYSSNLRRVHMSTFRNLEVLGAIFDTREQKQWSSNGE